MRISDWSSDVCSSDLLRKQQRCKFRGDTDAPMGGQSPFYFAAMDSNTIIGKTQHLSNRCIVEIGNMVFILLHNGEGAQRSRLATGPIKNARRPYFIAGAPNRQPQFITSSPARTPHTHP